MLWEGVLGQTKRLVCFPRAQILQLAYSSTINSTCNLSLNNLGHKKVLVNVYGESLFLVINVMLGFCKSFTKVSLFP